MLAVEAGGAVEVLVGLVVVLVAAAIYMLPTIVGASRKVVNVGSVFAINLFLGWTLIGWVVALAMALRTNPPQAYPQMWQGPMVPGAGGHIPLQAAPPPPAGWYPDPFNATVRRWWDGRQWTATTSDQYWHQPGS